MADEDQELARAFVAWFATRPKHGAAAGYGVLERAERRLNSAIKRGESPSRLMLCAERVRQAQLGWIRAQERAAALPTDVDDEQTRRQCERRAAAQMAWERASIEDIIALYSTTRAPR